MYLDCNAQAVFEVIFCPKQPVKSYGQVQLNVHGNQYENTVVWLVGEGYLEEVTFDNIMLDPQHELQLKTESLDNCTDNDNIQGESITVKREAIFLGKKYYIDFYLFLK